MTKKKKKLTIGKTRSFLYKTAQILGDVNAVKRGRVKERLMNRLVGYIINRLWKKK